jgi:hypothetical protein
VEEIGALREHGVSLDVLDEDRPASRPTPH